MQLQQGLRLIQQSYHLAGGIMSGLIQSTDRIFLEGGTSAYFFFIMQQIQLELDIYNLMLNCF
jgi:hypothetical protein